MKESTLIQMKNKINELNEIVHRLYMELTYQRQINEALANVCKQLPDWDSAVEKVQKANEEAKAKAEAENKVETDTESGLDLGPQESEDIQSEEKTQE